MISSDEQFYYINLNSTDEQKIYLEISNKKFDGSKLINIEYQDDVITFSLSTRTILINDNNDIDIFFQDAYIDKIRSPNAQHYNRRDIISYV